MSEFISFLVGAVLGALSGGAVTWLYARKVIDKLKATADRLP